MRQNNAVVSSMLALLVYTSMPNVLAFFGGLTSHKFTQRFHSYSKNDAVRYKKVAGGSSSSSISTTLSALPTLLADPMPNSIGNFFENKTDDMSFIQCYMLSVAVVDGLQYGTITTQYHLISSDLILLGNILHKASSMWSDNDLDYKNAVWKCFSINYVNENDHRSD